MCKFHPSPKGKTRKYIDKCMVSLIEFINSETHFRTLGCCCGHGKYRMTIIAENKKDHKIYEILSGGRIGRKRRYYFRDKAGYYYIPEVERGYGKN